MNELIETKPDIQVEEGEFKRLLGYPNNHKLEGRSRELADWAREWYTQNGNPWIYAIYIEGLNLSNKKLRISNIEFESEELQKNLAEAYAHEAILTVVSAGRECEERAFQLWQDGKPDEYFFLEVYGSAVVEHLLTTTGFRLCEWAERNNVAVMSHYSPGYPGWRIEDQKQLLKLIRQMSINKLPGEIDILETGMLKPKKSMLALFGITKYVSKVQNLRELIPCQTCSLRYCQYRRIPYKYSRIRIEDIDQLQTKSSKLISKGNLALTENTLIPRENKKVNSEEFNSPGV